jgi:nucleoside-diphosphate-sugar epimerase
MKILIVGGCGYVGGYLTDYLITTGYDITVYDNLMYESRFLKNVSFIYGDIRDLNKLNKIINDYDVVVWLAALVGDGACAINPQLTELINYGCTQWLVDNYKGKIVFMSTCHDESTLLLTKQGLKKYDEINISDKVLTINTNNKNIEWKGIKRIIQYDYDGDMINVDGRRVSFSMTPDHKMLVKKKDEKLLYSPAKDVKKLSHCYLPTGGNYNGLGKECYEIVDDLKKDNFPDSMKTEDLFFMSGLYIGDGYSCYGEKEVENKSGLNRKDFLTECRDNKTGRFVSKIKEGNIKETTCKSWHVGFCLPDTDPSRATLLDILNRYGIKYWTTAVRIGVTSERLFNFVKQFGKGAHKKRIPSWMLDYDKKYLQRLFDGLIMSDGNHAQYIQGKQPQYTTVSNQLVSDCIIIGTKLGYSVTFRKRYCESKIGIREIKGDSFVICFSTANKYVPKKCFSSSNYCGKVWCLEVEDNNNFMVCRKGKVNWSGNCSVYGINDHLIDETASPNPLSIYAETKVKSEKYIIENSKNYLIFRLGTLFGLGDQFSRLRLDLVTNILTLKATNGQPLTVFGGEQWRPLLHVKDVSTAIGYCLHNDITGLYNLSYKNYTIREMAEVIQNVVPGSELVCTDMKFEDLRNYRVKTDKFDITGWKPIYDLEYGINEIHKTIKEGRIVNPSDPVYSNAVYLKEKI